MSFVISLKDDKCKSTPAISKKYFENHFSGKHAEVMEIHCMHKNVETLSELKGVKCRELVMSCSLYKKEFSCNYCNAFILLKK